MEKKIKLSLLQKEVLFGVILGDAHLETQNNRITYRVKFEQSIKHTAYICLLYTSPSPRDLSTSRMPSSA